MHMTSDDAIVAACSDQSRISRVGVGVKRKKMIKNVVRTIDAIGRRKCADYSDKLLANETTMCIHCDLCEK